MTARGARFFAKQQGEPRYWTGFPCKHGHISWRATNDGKCIACRQESDRKNYRANAQEIIRRKKQYYAKNADLVRQKRRQKYAQNPDAELIVARKRSAEWRAKNPEKVRAQSILKKTYKIKNPEKTAFFVAKRRSAKMQRTPCWLGKDDWWAIKEIYDLAYRRTQATNMQWHVDHIIPLQGATVSGLHVPWNLQVVPWQINVTKGRKFGPDVVSALGNGSTKAGSDKLYEMMHAIRDRARSSHPKDLPPPAKSPLDYLKDSRKSRR